MKPPFGYHTRTSSNKKKFDGGRSLHLKKQKNRRDVFAFLRITIIIYRMNGAMEEQFGKKRDISLGGKPGVGCWAWVKLNANVVPRWIELNYLCHWSRMSSVVT